MQNLKYKKIALCLGLLLLVGFVITSPALAVNIGDLGDNAAKQFSGLAAAAKAFAFFAGFVLVIGSIVMFAGMKKPGNQTTAMVPTLMLVCGLVLISIMTFIQIGSTSVLMDDSSGTAMSELGIN